MFADPVMQRTELVFGCLQRQNLAELCLAAGSLEKDHEISGNGQCQRTSQIFFHECQSEIDAGCDTRRGPNRIVAHENGIGLEMHGRKTPGELSAESPVSNRPPSIEHPGGTKQKSA